jgi:hypothetical protein
MREVKDKNQNSLDNLKEINFYDQEYYTKILKKKLIEKTISIERITKKWDNINDTLS